MVETIWNILPVRHMLASSTLFNEGKTTRANSDHILYRFCITILADSLMNRSIVFSHTHHDSSSLG